MDTKITSGTIIRTALLALALLNQVLTALGVNPIPIDDDTLQQLISAAFTVITAAVAWWKNNSFTQAAIIGDDMMNSVKTQQAKG